MMHNHGMRIQTGFDEGWDAAMKQAKKEEKGNLTDNVTYHNTNLVCS